MFHYVVLQMFCPCRLKQAAMQDGTLFEGLLQEPDSTPLVQQEKICTAACVSSSFTPSNDFQDTVSLGRRWYLMLLALIAQSEKRVWKSP